MKCAACILKVYFMFYMFKETIINTIMNTLMFETRIMNYN